MLYYNRFDINKIFMLKVVTVINIIIATSVFPQTNEWTIIQTPVSSNLKNIYAIDSSHIWVAGDSGYILFTGDLGDSWSVQNYHPDFKITDIFFLNTNEGWAIANGIEDQINVTNYILITTDGGLSWQSKRFRPDNVNLYTICFLNSNKGIIGGDNNIFAITFNGGDEWIALERDTATFSHFPVRKIRFINDSVGFAVGGIYDRGGIIWHCTDSGLNWVTDSAYADPFFDMTFAGENTIVALASDIERSFPSAVFKSSDLGNSWFHKEIPFYGVSNGIDNRTLSEIWGTFEKEFIVSYDQGESWQTFSTPDSITVFDIAFTDSMHGFSVGQDGKFLIYRPLISNVESEPVLNNDYFIVYQNYPNPFNSSTNIRLEVLEDDYVEISIYNSLGEKLFSLLKGSVARGMIEIKFDAKDLASGIYFYVLESSKKSFLPETTRLINKMILLR